MSREWEMLVADGCQTHIGLWGEGTGQLDLSVQWSGGDQGFISLLTAELVSELHLQTSSAFYVFLGDFKRVTTPWVVKKKSFVGMFSVVVRSTGS